MWMQVSDFSIDSRTSSDPEVKRKRIGAEFIAVFEEEARKLGDIPWLAQGTLYPDVIESVSFKGPSADHQDPSQRRRPAARTCSSS